MRFSSLSISNFKAVSRFEIDDLTDFILVAGPNGSGKSAVLDAIRLLKSVYGGYQSNEWRQWFDEFQINIRNRSGFRRLFRDATREVVIDADVQISDTERDYLRASAEEIREPLVWQAVTGQPLENYGFSSLAIATQFRQFGEEVTQQVAESAAVLRASLTQDTYHLSLRIGPDLNLRIEPNLTMETVFQTYEPEKLGIIDYHSASRTYARETVGGINLDVSNLEAQRRQWSLYNWQAKYQNVKAELATTYLRELIARDAGVAADTSDLNTTLRELFQAFFPEKEYLGVQPDPGGEISFPVRLATGETHDINELSSGEKEVLYGYLRLRSSTPRNSTILLDEPELHLNPALLRGFPDFYHRHIGRGQGNQLWLVTHSDTLLRQAVGNSSYSVFHMTTAASAAGENQALEVVADDALQRATVDLVGDLATYRPNGKVVILEGGGDSEFDVSMVQRLFPDFARRVNLVSGGGKRRVRDLYEVLAATAQQAQIGQRFYAIVDKDTEASAAPEAAASRSWDVYHIENYLLVPKYVRGAAAAILPGAFANDGEVRDALQACAAEVIPRSVLRLLQSEINGRFVSAIVIAGPPDASSPADALMPSIEASIHRLGDASRELGALEVIKEKATAHEEVLSAAIADETWTSVLPGREVLQRFVDKHLGGNIRYEAFRNLVIEQMAEDGYQPPGMARLLERILEEA